MISNKTAVYGVAGLGGSASNWVDVATSLTRGEPWAYGIAYFVGVGLFFCLGVALAWIFEENDRRRAFFVGLSMPAFIASAQTQVATRLSPQEPPAVVSMPREQSFIKISSPVHAQTVSGPQRSASGTQSEGVQGDREEPVLRITLLKGCPDCVVWIVDDQGRLLEEETLSGDEEDVRLALKSGSSYFGIWNAQINAKLWPIRSASVSGGTLNYEFDYGGNWMNDLRRGLGNYNIRPYDPLVSEVAARER